MKKRPMDAFFMPSYMITFEPNYSSMRVISIICFIALFTSCSSTPEGFVINGELRGDVEDGTQVFLKTTDSLNRLVEVDTTTLTAGRFTFSGMSDTPIMHYVFFDNIRGNAPIILENGTIDFKAQKDSLSYTSVKGTLQNDLFMEYLEESRRLASMSRSMNEDFRRANAPGNKDTAAIEALREEYLELQEKARTFEIDYVKEHPDALISVLILGKITNTKVLPASEIEELFNALSPAMQNTHTGKGIKAQLQELKKVAIGSPAPDFSGPTPEGNELALNDIKGKLTLIDFWAAWCRPCRMENPNIVSVYNKYHDKGLNVIGVSLDRKKEDWLGAIEVDGLEWNHVSHLQYFRGPIAELYNVNAIPAAFLLDENGIIIAKNLRGPALEEKVAELLN